MSTEPSLAPETIQQAKREIERLFREMGELSRQKLAPEVFFDAFLERLATALAALAAGVWMVDGDGRPHLARHVNLDDNLYREPTEEGRRNELLVRRVVHEAKPVLVPPASELAESDYDNPTDSLILLAPIYHSAGVAGVIEIFERPVEDPQVRRGYLRFLTKAADLASNWVQANSLVRSRRDGSDESTEVAVARSDRQNLWIEVDGFCKSVHESLDLKETAYAIANDGRGIIKCDRLSVAVCRAGKCKVEALSGQDVFDKRSNIVRLLGKLTTAVVKAGDPLWYAGSDEDLPDPIRDALHAYIEESFTKTLAVIPLRRPVKSPTDDEEENRRTKEGEIIGALIVEQVEAERPWPAMAERIGAISEHSTRALMNAIDHGSLFLMPVWKTLGKGQTLVHRRTLPKTLAVVAAIVMLLAALLLIPVDFNLSGEGTLQPKQRRSVFAQVEGVVKRVNVSHGQFVQEGDVLFELQDPDLEVQRAEVQGQLEAAEDALASANRTLLEQTPTRDVKATKDATDITQLETRRDNLRSQLELLNSKLARLKVRAPISGQVVTWNIDKLLDGRPIKPGQVLAEVADPSGEWELEVYMPETRVGYVARAIEQSSDPLPVKYVTAVGPGRSRIGQLREMHVISELHEQQGQSVKLSVDVEEDDLIAPRPGLGVTAKVRCGRCCVAFAWGHELIEFVQRKILF